MSQSRASRDEISARVCGTIAVVAGAALVWMAASIGSTGGEWSYSMLGSFIPLLFALQGLRLSRAPGAKWPRYSLVTSIVGLVLGGVTCIWFLVLLMQSVSV